MRALLILALLTGCAAIPSPQPPEGLRAPEIPMVTIWRKTF